MARGDLGSVLNVQGQSVIAEASGDHPIEDVKRLFRNNIHKANRKAKKLLTREVKNRLRRGVPGEGYDPDYAERKREDTGRLYGSSGPVDFRYSGRLWNELVGRGRAKPSEPSLTFWLALKHPNRMRPSTAPGGGGITYRRLTEVLEGRKPGTYGEPFAPDRSGRRAIVRGVVERLMND